MNKREVKTFITSNKNISHKHKNKYIIKGGIFYEKQFIKICYLYVYVQVGSDNLYYIIQCISQKFKIYLKLYKKNQEQDSYPALYLIY
jgi:hypothetical protein